MNDEDRRTDADRAEQFRLGMCDCCYRRHKRRVAVYSAVIVFVGAFLIVGLIPTAILVGIGVPYWLAGAPSGMCLGYIGRALVQCVKDDW